MPTSTDYSQNILLQYLPALYSGDDLLARYLLAFQNILLGLTDKPEEWPAELQVLIDSVPQAEGKEYVRNNLQQVIGTTRGLEEIIAALYTFFDPQATPPHPQTANDEDWLDDWLNWLSGWVAINLRADLSIEKKRNFISMAVQLYRMRGTVQGLREAIKIYTDAYPTIDELSGGFQIGVRSRVGKDTILSGGTPYFFHVTIAQADVNIQEMKNRVQVVKAILDQEKPAHTDYKLDVVTPRMQVGVHSRIGVDTLLGPAS